MPARRCYLATLLLITIPWEGDVDSVGRRGQHRYLQQHTLGPTGWPPFQRDRIRGVSPRAGSHALSPPTG